MQTLPHVSALFLPSDTIVPCTLFLFQGSSNQMLVVSPGFQTRRLKQKPRQRRIIKKNETRSSISGTDIHSQTAFARNCYKLVFPIPVCPWKVHRERARPAVITWAGLQARSRSAAPVAFVGA